MRTIWNGSITFGLVNIPVGMALATKPAARQSDVSFRTLHRECLTPIKQKRWCPTHDREVERDELVKGWEVAKGEFVVVEDADLEAIEQIDDSKSIEITRFVDAEEVDPVFFDRTYYLAPAREPAARRPYVLLLRAMQETGKAALGRFVRQNTEHLCLIRAKGDTLALETMFLAEDVNSQAEIEETVAESKVKEAELDLARQVIDSLAGEFDPADLTSEYRTESAADARGEARRPGDHQAGGRADRDAGRRSHGGAQAERRRGLGEEARQARESRPEERLSKTRSGAEERLNRTSTRRAPLVGAMPNAWSCAAKRVLSILP